MTPTDHDAEARRAVQQTLSDAETTDAGAPVSILAAQVHTRGGWLELRPEVARALGIGGGDE